MKVKCNIVVNNDVKIPILMQNQTVKSLTKEQIESVYRIYQTQNRPVARFYILNVEGLINIGVKENCTNCRSSKNTAGFNIEYVHGVPEKWSLFLSLEGQPLIHIDDSTFTAKKLLDFIKIASGFSKWDETLIKEWSRHANFYVDSMPEV